MEKFIVFLKEKFYRNFLIKSDNGRSSLRITNTFSLKVASVEFEAIDNNIRLHFVVGVGLVVGF
jgi:hypothetical protein